MSGPVGSGLSAQFMFAEEASWGVYQAPTRGIDLVNEAIKLPIQRIESKGLRAGRKVQQSNQWLPGKRSVAGPVELEVANVGFGLLFKHALGAVATSTPAAGVYQHTFTPAPLAGHGLTVQVGKPSVNGTVNPHSYTGCKVQSWELSLKTGELLKLKLDLVGQDETTAQALVPFPELPAAYDPLSFVGASVQVAGTQVDLIDFAIKGDNKLDAQRFRLRGAATPKEPLEADFAEYAGTLTADFTDETLYQKYVNANEFSVVATFDGGLISGAYNYQVQLTMNARADGETPVVPGPAILQQPLPIKLIAPVGQADGGAITVVYQTTDATP